MGANMLPSAAAALKGNTTNQGFNIPPACLFLLCCWYHKCTRGSPICQRTCLLLELDDQVDVWLQGWVSPRQLCHRLHQLQGGLRPLEGITAGCVCVEGGGWKVCVCVCVEGGVCGRGEGGGVEEGGAYGCHDDKGIAVHML
jgi:hypothetical protein